MAHVIIKIIAYLTMLVVGFTVLGVLYKPYLAIPLMLTLYSVEQIFMRVHPFFQTHPSFYNYFIGLVCVAGLVSGYFRKGSFKSFSLSGFSFLFGLLMLSWCSFLWTPAPEAAFVSLVHYSLEALLVFFLPFFTITSIDDYKKIAVLLGCFALGVSLIIIFFPVAGISGRHLLVSNGTVLSPSTMILTAITFLIFTIEQKNKITDSLYFIIILLMLLGLFLLGARTQFSMGVMLALYYYVFCIGRKQKIVIFYSLVLLISAGAFMSFAGLSTYQFSRNKIDLNNKMRDRRFSVSDLERGISQRIDMIKPSFSLKAPVFGNGIMSWSYLVFGSDEYRYPHNSLIQLYYEVGLTGLFLFLGFNFYGVRRGLAYYKRNKDNPILRNIGAMLLCYWLFSFILSLKQGTFMSCLGVYTSTGMLLAAYSNFVTDGPNRGNMEGRDNPNHA